MFYRLILVLCLLSGWLYAQQKPKAKAAELAQDTEGLGVKTLGPALVTSVLAADLQGFNDLPRPVQGLIESSLALTRQDLTYQFGSSDPKNGGMDCSGCIYHVLRFNAIPDVPRQSVGMAQWVSAKSTLHLTPTATSLSHEEFAALQPGDLVFWTGTWEREGRGSAVSHVMIYLGKHKVSGKPLLFGSSDGRTYQGSSQRGVSVFDFTLPKAGGKAALYGYGRVPGLMKNVPKPDLATARVPSPVKEKPAIVPPPPTVGVVKKPTPSVSALVTSAVAMPANPAVTVRKAEPAVPVEQSAKSTPAKPSAAAKPTTPTTKPVSKPPAKPATAVASSSAKPKAKTTAKAKPKTPPATTPAPQRKAPAKTNGLPQIHVDPKKALRRIGDALEDLFRK